MYHDSVQSLAKTVQDYIADKDLIGPGDRIGVAVSGGADSMGLARLLLELRKDLGIVLSVVHFNHQLRGLESEKDERFVAEFAKKYDLAFYRESRDAKAFSSERKLSIETAARELRYEYFHCLLRQGKVDKIATAHTLDDQAETVLLKVSRGAGTRGMAGIYPRLVFGCDRGGQAIVRPLLCVRRKAIVAYLESIGQGWREDESNRDLHHSRNRVRQSILPILEKDLNPAIAETLAETAEIARAEEEYWSEAVQPLVKSAWKISAEGGALDTRGMADLPLAVKRRVIRAAGESLGIALEFRHVEEIVKLITGAKEAGSVVLPDGWRARLHKGEMTFYCEGETGTPDDYDFALSLPGAITVPPAGSRFEALIVTTSKSGVYNPEHLLDAAVLGPELHIRNWRAGDRFWPSHSKAPKKIKELLQERHVNGPERKLWPVVLSGSEVIWMRGFAAPRKLQAKVGAEAVLIRETPLEHGSK